MKHVLGGALVAVALLAQSGAAHAHHSLSAYDITKSITVNGTIKRYEWTAPHCWLVVTAVDASGKTVDWEFEAGTPVVNYNYGWTRDKLKAGEKVVIKAAPVRDGSPHGALMSVTLSNGKKLEGPLATYLKQ